MNGPISLWLSNNLEIWKDETPKNQVRIKRVFIRVLLQDLNSQQMRQKLANILGNDQNKIRQFMALRPKWANSEFSNRYKLAILRYRKNNIYIFRSFNFEMHSTFQELHDLANRHIWKVLRESQKKVIQPLSISHQEKTINSVINDLQPRLYGFSYKKNSFIVNTYNMSHDDMVNELMCKVIENARWQYPFKSYPHIIHSCYLAASNHGINRIKYYTAQKRQRLVSDGDTGFFSREISENAEFVNSELGNIDNTENIILDKIYYQDLLKPFKPGFEQDIATLLIGFENEPLVDKYLEWVNQQYNIKQPSIEKLRQGQLHRKYLTEYLGTDPIKVSNVFSILIQRAYEIVGL